MSVTVFVTMTVDVSWSPHLTDGCRDRPLLWNQSLIRVLQNLDRDREQVTTQQPVSTHARTHAHTSHHSPAVSEQMLVESQKHLEIHR